MKNLSFLWIILLLVVFGCGVKPQNQLQSTGLTYLPELSTFDQMTLESRGYAKRKDDLSPEAAKTAIQGLLLEGIANSPYSKPLVSDPGSTQTHASFWENFWKTGNYTRYVINIVPMAPAVKEKSSNRFQQLHRVSINVTALKSHLENEGIIARFGL